MIFKIMKKKSLSLPFKSNFFKEQDPFHLVVVFFIIFFSTAIFFSIPTFYDYKKYNQQIENTINKEFKINMTNLKGISFRFIPSPHLLIKKADLKIGKNEKKELSKLKNVKVFISLLDLYNKDIFKIKRLEVKKANFYLNTISLKNFSTHLKKNIVNKLIIKNSTVFFRDINDEVVLISKFKDFDYKIDFVNNKKVLKINGNVFDSDFELKYLLDYEFPNIQNLSIELKNPNIYFENIIEDNFQKENNIRKGNLILQFLSQKNNILYKIDDNNIKFSNSNIRNSTFNLKGSLNYKHFYFNLSLDLLENNLTGLENYLYLIYKNENLKFENLSGKLRVNLKNIDHKSLKKGWIQLNFEDSKLKLEDAKFDIGDFAVLTISEYEYLENNNQILQMKIKIKINNKEKFNRFLFNYKKDKLSVENLYFTYQHNVDTGNNFISQVRNKGFSNDIEFYKFNNFQQLKNLLRDDNLFIMD